MQILNALLISTTEIVKADQLQVGNLNSAGINQESGYNTAKQTQTALGASRGGTNYDPYNEACIGQKGGDGNIAEQTQTSPGAGAVENLAQICQDGALNYATQVQVGGDNSSIISQVGNGNHAVVSQRNLELTHRHDRHLFHRLFHRWLLLV